MRVSMSATGSVSISVPPMSSPGALGHAGDHALVGELPQADPAEPELLEDRARAAALVAAAVLPRLVLLRPCRLGDQGLLSHRASAPVSRSRAESPGRATTPPPARRSPPSW